MKINSQMVMLAREFRELTQEDLARKICTSQATIVRIESDLEAGVTEDRLILMAHALDFPKEFFFMPEAVHGIGSHAFFYRKRADVSATDLKRIHGMANIIRINIKKLLNTVEIVPKRKLPSLEVEQYGSASRLAQAVRGFWNIPGGPIKNVTALIESAGIIVVPCNFNTRSLDATSIRLTEMPPLIFINVGMPADRWRFTLVHELAHLIIHQVPSEEMENQADEFSAEFLMPELEMRAYFSQRSRVRLVDLINVKPYWKVSIAALLERAYQLNFVNDNGRRYLWANLRAAGYPNEPQPIEKERPKNLENILSYFLKELGLLPEELADTLHIRRQDLESLHAPACGDLASRPRHVRAVQ